MVKALWAAVAIKYAEMHPQVGQQSGVLAFEIDYEVVSSATSAISIRAPR